MNHDTIDRIEVWPEFGTWTISACAEDGEEIEYLAHRHTESLAWRAAQDFADFHHVPAIARTHDGTVVRRYTGGRIASAEAAHLRGES